MITKKTDQNFFKNHQNVSKCIQNVSILRKMYPKTDTLLKNRLTKSSEKLYFMYPKCIQLTQKVIFFLIFFQTINDGEYKKSYICYKKSYIFKI